jgi:hypothetical protein
MKARPSRLLAGLLLGFGCGQTTSLGNVRPGPDGAGATESDGGELGASGASGAGGEADGSTMDDAAPVCHLPEPSPVTDPTPQELHRTRLVRDFCTTLGRDGCLNAPGGWGFIGQAGNGCSIERRITACESEELFQYSRLVIPACDDEWQAALQCAAGANYAVPDPCVSASVFAGWQTSGICQKEKAALGACLGYDGSSSTVAGSRTICHYGGGAISACEVRCRVGRDAFASECSGRAGLPVRCECWANGHSMTFLRWGGPNWLYTSDCREAARYMADGAWCTDSLDCCLEHVMEGEQQCDCASLNVCETGRSLGGVRVERCSKYDPF